MKCWSKAPRCSSYRSGSSSRWNCDRGIKRRRGNCIWKQHLEPPWSTMKSLWHALKCQRENQREFSNQVPLWLNFQPVVLRFFISLCERNLAWNFPRGLKKDDRSYWKAEGYGSQLSLETPAWTENILAKVFFSSCVYTDLAILRTLRQSFVLDFLLISVEGNCCKNRTCESKQYLQNASTFLKYVLLLLFLNLWSQTQLFFFFFFETFVCLFCQRVNFFSCRVMNSKELLLYDLL